MRYQETSQRSRFEGSTMQGAPVGDDVKRLECPEPKGASAQSAPYVPEYPTLREVVAAYPMPEARLVLVTHALDTAVPYVRALAGQISIEVVVAVPYSAQPHACATLKADGLPIVVPDSIEDVGRTAVEFATLATGRGRVPVAIQEVGGYCAELVHEMAAQRGLRGVVEDTKQGQWRYERARPLPLPVFTIADSPLKSLEDSQVGRAVAYSTEHLVRRHFYRLVTELRVAVLGYGGIGVATARCFRNLGARVGVYDRDPIRMSQAVVDGHEPFARDALLRWADVVVGVSGNRTLTENDFALLRNGVILASGSSKQVEFDVQALRRQSTCHRDEGEVSEFEVAGRRVFLLNDGRPVNFLHQSILGNVLDVVYSELYMCTRELMHTSCEPGLRRLNPELQRDLASRWCSNHGQGRWN